LFLNLNSLVNRVGLLTGEERNHTNDVEIFREKTIRGPVVNLVVSSGKTCFPFNQS